MRAHLDRPVARVDDRELDERPAGVQGGEGGGARRETLGPTRRFAGVALDLDAAEKAANAAAKARPEYSEYEAALRELRAARGDPRGEATGTTRPEKDERRGRR